MTELSVTAWTSELAASRRDAAAVSRADMPLMIDRPTPGRPPTERTRARPRAALTPRSNWTMTSTFCPGCADASVTSWLDRLPGAAVVPADEAATGRGATDDPDPEPAASIQVSAAAARTR